MSLDPPLPDSLAIDCILLYMESVVSTFVRLLQFCCFAIWPCDAYGDPWSPARKCHKKSCARDCIEYLENGRCGRLWYGRMCMFNGEPGVGEPTCCTKWTHSLNNREQRTCHQAKRRRGVGGGGQNGNKFRRTHSKNTTNKHQQPNAARVRRRTQTVEQN